MVHNIPFLERLIRGAIGIGLLGLFGALPAPWCYVTLIGLWPLGTALTGNCPIYTAAARRGIRFIGPERGGTR